MYTSSLSSSYSSPSSPSRYGRSSSAADRASSAIGTSSLSGSRYSSSGLLTGTNRPEDRNDVSNSSFRRGGTYSSSNGYDRPASGSSGYRYFNVYSREIFYF